MQARSERFEMRLDPEILVRVDDWRIAQRDMPSRAEAIRRLVETGLAAGADQSKEVRFSDGEKLSLVMLSEIYDHLKVEGGANTKLIQSAIYGGHYWGLEWEMNGLFHSHADKKEVVTEVVDVLDMWSFIESGYKRLSAKDRAFVEKEADPFGKHVSFAGFDGNNEGQHYSVARFLVNELDRFSEFKSRDLNSHMPSIDGYRRMLAVFLPIRKTLIGADLSASQIATILKAWIHPSRLPIDEK